MINCHMSTSQELFFWGSFPSSITIRKKKLPFTSLFVKIFTILLLEAFSTPFYVSCFKDNFTFSISLQDLQFIREEFRYLLEKTLYRYLEIYILGNLIKKSVLF